MATSLPPRRESPTWPWVWGAVAAGTDRLTYWNGVVTGLLVLVFAMIPSRSLATDYVDPG